MATAASILGKTSFKSKKNGAVKIKAEWQVFYNRLLELREQLLRQMNGLAKESAQEMAGYSLHMADSGTDNFDRDFALSLLSSDQDAVFEIEEALKRIEKKTYGVLVGGQQAQREVAVKIIRAGIRHVQAVAGEFLGGFLGEAVHLLDELLAQIEQILAEAVPFGLDPLQVKTKTVARTSGFGGMTTQDRRRRGDGLLFATRRSFFLHGFFLCSHN